MNEAQWKAHAQRIAEPHLRQLIADLQGVTGAIVASSDGFEIAAVAAPNAVLPASRLAAMASAMQGLGEAMAGETGLQKARDIIVDSDAGKVLLMSIPGPARPLVLMTIVNAQSAFGQLLLQCRKCCVAIGSQLDSRRAGPAVVNQLA